MGLPDPVLGPALPGNEEDVCVAHLAQHGAVEVGVFGGGRRDERPVLQPDALLQQSQGFHGNRVRRPLDHGAAQGHRGAGAAELERRGHGSGRRQVRLRRSAASGNQDHPIAYIGASEVPIGRYGQVQRAHGVLDGPRHSVAFRLVVAADVQILQVERQRMRALVVDFDYEGQRIGQGIKGFGEIIIEVPRRRRNGYVPARQAGAAFRADAHQGGQRSVGNIQPGRGAVLRRGQSEAILRGRIDAEERLVGEELPTWRARRPALRRPPKPHPRPAPPPTGEWRTHHRPRSPVRSPRR